MINTAWVLWKTGLAWACHLNRLNLKQLPHCTQSMNYLYVFIFSPTWEEVVTEPGSVGQWYCMCCLYQYLLLRQHKGVKLNAGIMWVFLESPLSIFWLFWNGMAQTQGSNCPYTCLLWPVIYILYIHMQLLLCVYIYTVHIYLSAYLLFLLFSRLPSENSFNALQSAGCGLARYLSLYMWVTSLAIFSSCSSTISLSPKWDGCTRTPRRIL